MRVLSDNPNEMMAAIVEQHLGPPLWLTAEAVAVLMARDQGSEPLVLYSDGTYQTTINPDATPRTKCLALRTREGKTLRILARLYPDVGNGKYPMYLTADRSIILLLQTHAARKSDGVIQIYGAEPGLMVFTPEKIRAFTQSPATLIGGDVVASFHVEEKNSTAEWAHVDVSFTIPRGMWREIREDED